MLIGRGGEECHAHRLAPRLDRHLVEPVLRAAEHAGERVTGLVHRDDLPFAVGRAETGALLPQQQPVACRLDVPPRHGVRTLARGDDRRFVHQVGEVGPAGLRHQSREAAKIHVLRDRHRALGHVQPEDRLPLVHAREPNRYGAVEPAGAEQRRIEVLGAVSGADDQHAFSLREAVHLHQQLVEGAVVLVVAPVVATARAKSVDLVDEDDAAPLPRLPEQRP